MPSFAESFIRRHWQMFAVLLLCAASGLVQAQSASDSDDSADPPGRVARLSYVAGDLGLLPSGASDWGDASLNRPLTTGDKLSSGAGARAELEVGGGTLRIAGRTDLGLLDLDDQLAQIELTQGSLSLTVRQLEQGQSYEIDTPTVAVVIDQPASLRVDIDDDGHTRVTDYSGTATVYGENNAQRPILSGRSYRFADSALGAVEISEIDGNDAFGRWVRERDRRYATASDPGYVDDDVVGYRDLDEYGGWEQNDDYGEVWYPAHVAADWAPYRNGHWAYIGPWGWTWVDDAPWGFAPYHYGRWAYTHRGWGWIPGPRGIRPVYAPALVAFVGGGGWSVGLGGAPVGWFPLGPRDIYNPWYRSSRDYYTRVNAHNLRDRHWRDRDADIRDHYEHYHRGIPMREQAYANRQSPRGFTAVSAQAFAHGRHVQHDLLHVDARKLAGAPVLARGTALRPEPGSFVRARTGHARVLPPGGFDRAVVARHAPPSIMHTEGMPRRMTGLASQVNTGNHENQVRVLDRHERSIPPARDSRRGFDRSSNGRTGSLPIEHADRMALPREAPRSSRFAHPLPQPSSMRGEPRDDHPRPIDDRRFERNASPAVTRDMRTLPAPRIERAPSMAPNREINRQPPRDLSREPPRQQPSFQRMENRQREMPQPRAMPRQSYQPHDQPAPRAVPERRPEPARSAPRSEPAHEREHDHRH